MLELMIGLYNTPRGTRSYCTMYFNVELDANEAVERAHDKIQNGRAHNRDYLLNCLSLGNFRVSII